MERTLSECNSEPVKVVLLGAGNVATHLAHEFSINPAFRIIQIYNRTLSHAVSLCEKVNCAAYTDNIDALSDDAELYILAMADDAIAEVAQILSKRHFHSGIWAHTSGSVPMDALAGIGVGQGVFYPLMTFSREEPVDMSAVPFFIEGSDTSVFRRLTEIARYISSRVYQADSNLRKHMHLAAVFACNFTNHMLTIAKDRLADVGLPLDVMRPLVEATVAKAFGSDPLTAQTGPAVRGDTGVLEGHMSMIGNMSEKEIYRLISDDIIARHRK